MDRWLGASLLLTACYEGPADVDAVTTSGSTSDDVSTRGSSVTSSEVASSGAATASTGDTASTSSSSSPSSSSSESTGEPSDCAVTMVAGSTTQTIDVNGVERSYLVVVPQSLDGATSPAPVLMGFHGGNGTSEYASQAYGLTGDEPALYVYPQAPYWKEAGGVAWDVDPEGVDFPYFDAMLDDLAERYCVDADRIFAAGQSNGAFFVNELGCRRSDALRAIAPVAGGGPLYYPDCAGTIAVMVVHGSADGTVPVQQGIDAREFWLAQNGCAGASATPTEPSPCVVHEDCDEPVLWCEHDGGHDWPAFAGPAIRGFFLGL